MVKLAPWRDRRESYENRKKIHYPANHLPVLQVPEGGSMCANCKFVSDDLKHCSSEDFILYNGSNKLPYEAHKMCSDWWMPKGKKEEE